MNEFFQNFLVVYYVCACIYIYIQYRGLGVQTDFVRSVTLDTWTEDQLALMKIGGNEKCVQYLEEQGVTKDITIKEKYNSEAAKHYKTILVAAVKGELAPPALVQKKKDSPSNDGDEDNKIESLEDLVRSDPSVAYSQLVLPVLSFFWNHILCPMIHPLVLGVVSLILGGILYAFPHNGIVRVSVIVAFALPLIGSALYLVKFINIFINI